MANDSPYARSLSGAIEKSETVVWTNPDAMALMCAQLTPSQVGMAFMLVAHIAENGPIAASQVRQILRLAPRKHGIPLQRLSSLFVGDAGMIDLNDYSFVVERREVAA